MLVGGLLSVLSIYIMKRLDKIDEVYFKEIDENLRTNFEQIGYRKLSK